MTLTFVNNPQTPFVVQQVGTMVQIKPFAGYYRWLDWFDLAPLDQSALIDDLQDDVDAAAAVAAAAQTTADSALAASAVVGHEQARLTFWMDETIYSVGTKTIVHDAAQNFGVMVYAAGINNACSFVFWTYSTHLWIEILYGKNNGSGVATFDIDGSVVTAVDMYNSTALYNQYLNLGTGYTMAQGRHVLTIKALSKNASSSGYALLITKIWIRDVDR